MMVTLSTAWVATLSKVGVYAVAWLLILQCVFLCRTSVLLQSWLIRFVRVVYAVAVGLLVAVFALRSMAADFFALTNMFESVLAVVCGLSACTWFALRGAAPLMLQQGMRAVLLATNLVSLGLLALALFRLDASIQPLAPSLVSYWRAIHVPLIMLSYSLMLSASVAGVLQLLTPAEHPNQPVLAQWALKHVQFAFPCLTVGVLLGAVWANEAWGSYWNWDPKENMALATLLLYASYWHLSMGEQFSPRSLAWLLVGGLLVLILTYFGVNLLGVGLHSYGKF
jgi:ABC-type transport system involved in cytochrome c biogenesis permease subunit